MGNGSWLALQGQALRKRICLAAEGNASSGVNHKHSTLLALSPLHKTLYILGLRNSAHPRTLKLSGSYELD